MYSGFLFFSIFSYKCVMDKKFNAHKETEPCHEAKLALIVKRDLRIRGVLFLFFYLFIYFQA